jgi:hypothetical protein
MHAALVTMTVVLVRPGFLMQEMPVGGHEARTTIACGVATQTEAVIGTLTFHIRPSTLDFEPTRLSHTASNSISMHTRQTCQPEMRHLWSCWYREESTGERHGALAWWLGGLVACWHGRRYALV